MCRRLGNHNCLSQLGLMRVSCPDECSVRPDVGMVREGRQNSDGPTTEGERCPESNVLGLVWSSVCCPLFVRGKETSCGGSPSSKTTVYHGGMVDSKVSAEGVHQQILISWTVNC